MLNGLFRYRRKTLSNGLLESGLCPDRPRADAALASAGIDKGRRVETLSLDEVIALEAALQSTPSDGSIS
jgi:16S rRNA A1518/A1519 N6-dimethyltransferase RsmA/KsgA/DIM1 with predicted DNA glycosylase/AP lyase activity